MILYRSKRFFQVILLLLILPLAADTGTAQAFGVPEQEQPPVTEPLGPPSVEDVDLSSGVLEFTFAQMGQQTFSMIAPTGAHAISLELPYRWVVEDGIDSTYMELSYDVIAEEIVGESVLEQELDLSTLNIYVDEVLTTALAPVPGLNQSLRIPLPAGVMNVPDENDHQIRFEYFGGRDCEDDLRTHVVVRNDSVMHITYAAQPVALNLADYPRPLVQDSFLLETVLIIVPDQYSELDLAAAASVAASIGRRTSGNTAVELITASEALPERMANIGAIVVGQPSKNEFLAGLYQLGRLPSRVSADLSQIIGPDNTPVAPGNGVLQLTTSHFNNEHVFLTVTGATDQAVVNAANALVTLDPRYGVDGNFSIIEDFRDTTESSPSSSVDTFTLAELGLRRSVFYGLGVQSESVTFFVPGDSIVLDDAALALSYSHSAQLSTAESSLTVELNNQPVGSVPIDGTTPGERQVAIPLPPEDFRPGEPNRLTFEVVNSLDESCVRRNTRAAWMRVRESSLVTIPRQTVSDSGSGVPFADPVSPLTLAPDASKILFAMPTNPTDVEVKGIAEIAWALGNDRRITGLTSRVVFGADPASTDFGDYYVIGIGRPTANPLISSINDSLPQAFVAGQDTLRQEIGSIVYALPADFDLGVIEVLPAPWDPGRALVVVTGTTDQGVAWAIDSYARDDLRGRLDGDISFIRAERIESFMSSSVTRSELEIAVEEVAEEEITLEQVEEEPVEEAVASGDVPEEFLPQGSSSPSAGAILAYVLVGFGVIFAVGGVVLTLRRGRNT